MEPSEDPQPKTPETTPAPLSVTSAKVIQPSESFIKAVQAEQSDKLLQSNSAGVPAQPPENNPHFQTLKDLPDDTTAFEEPKNRLPIGLIILASLSVVVGLYTLFTSNNTLNEVSAFFELIIGAGLLLRKELMRRIALILYGINVVLLIVALLGYVVLKQDIDNQANQAQQSLQMQSNNPSSPQQQAAVSAENTILQHQAVLDQESTRLYLALGLEIALNATLFIYLTRPAVTEVFS